ncbi:MAG: major capsid protein [Phycisphaerales bacterium]
MKPAVISSPKLLGNRLNALSMRPFVGEDGESYVIQMNSAGKPVKIKTNASALLQYDEWKDIDRTVIEAAVQRMVAVGDLRERGLEHNLGSIGVTLSLWDRQSDMTPAGISMSPKSRTEKDTVAYEPQVVPVPVVHKDFEIELRRLEASRRFGESLDVTQAAIAGRLVGERTEQMLFVGADQQFDGAHIYGYTTHPDRNQVDMDNPWNTLSTEQNVEILVDVMAMMAASRAARHYGPWILYIPAAYEGKMDEDYKGAASSDTRTVRERILALNGIEDIKVADFLTGNNVLLISLQKDVVDIAVAQDVTTVNWSTNGGMSEEFKVMAVWVPRVKSDYDGRSGITHLTPLSS